MRYELLAAQSSQLKAQSYMKHFKVTIRTPDELVYESSEIEELRVNTEEGPIVIYARHASLTGSVLFSTLSVKTKAGEEKFMARRGTVFFDMENNHAYLLMLSCQQLASISFEQAEEYLSYIESLIAAGEDISKVKLAYLEREKLAVQEEVEALKEVKI